MLWTDAEFWATYYRWCIRTPLTRAMDGMRGSLVTIQQTIADRFTPVIRKVAWAFEDFTFTNRLAEFPRWQHGPRRLLWKLRNLHRLIPR